MIPHLVDVHQSVNQADVILSLTESTIVIVFLTNSSRLKQLTELSSFGHEGVSPDGLIFAFLISVILHLKL